MTMQQRKTMLYNVSLVALVLAAFASAAGLFWAGLYRDNQWVTTQFQGADAVRLLFFVPLFLAAAVYGKRGSLRAELLWIGLLWTLLYDYAFYLFAAAFNELFLVYVVLFALPIFLLVLAIPAVDVQRVQDACSKRAPLKPIAIYLAMVAFVLGAMWLAQTIGFLITGEVPPSVTDSGHPTAVVFALDLSLLVPGLVWAAMALWKRHPWGYVLGSMMLVKGAIYPVALLGMTLFASRAGVPGVLDLLGFWLVFSIGGLTAALVFFGHLRTTASGKRSP